MNIPTIDLAQTGANIVNLRKAAGLTVADIQMVFGFNSLNTPGRNRQFDRTSPTPVPLKSYTLSAGPTPSV